jgi:hypothetical protein
MKDGSVTFGWFVRNRYYPLRDWRPETEKVKKIQIERDLVEKFDRGPPSHKTYLSYREISGSFLSRAWLTKYML